MPLYTYRNQDDPSDEFEVFQRMNDPHPETIERDGKVYQRVYGVAGGITRNHAVNYRGAPVSRSLPADHRPADIVTEHGRQIRVAKEDGAKSTMEGRPIIDSKKQRDIHKRRTGFQEG